MEIDRWKQAIQNTFKKGRGMQMLVLLGLCGIGLLYFSGRRDPEANDSTPDDELITASVYRQELEDGLVRIVSAITGDDKAQVMVTLEKGEEVVYAADSHTEAEQDRQETESEYVLIKDPDGGQSALTVTRIQPEVKGVVIVSRYASDPVVQEKLHLAVRVGLGISSTKVCVMDSG